MASQLADELKSGQSTRQEGLAESLIRVNALDYRLPSNMSVVVSRNLKRSYANLDSYQQNGKAIITWNTGTDYVDGINSYLTFKVKTVGAGSTATFASGSAINFIENITITSRSGVEVEREEGVNMLRRDIDRYSCSQDWLDHFGSVMGYGNQTISETESQFCIPLNRICGLCNTRKLIPSQLAGGLRWEIQLASVEQALQSLATVPTNYEITDLTMVLDTYQLADSIQKKLNQISAQSGLEFFYETHDRTKGSISSSSKASIVVRKAVSRALSAVAKTVLTDDAEKIAKDSFASETNDVSSFQWRLGSLYFPNQPLRTKEEMYYYAQYAFDKVKHCSKQNSVSLTDFTGTEGLTAVTLERSNVLGLSGLPLNNSRSLQLDIDYGDPQDRDIHVYIKYLKLARVFINNVVVKE